MDTYAWAEADETVARDAWNSVTPRAGGVVRVVSFVLCWLVVFCVAAVLPQTRATLMELKFSEDKTLLLIMLAIAYALSRVFVQWWVRFFRWRMPSDLVGVPTWAFRSQGFEIVGGNDHEDQSDDSMVLSEQVADQVKTLLFCLSDADRRIEVLAYPTGSTVGERGNASRLVMLISGRKIRIESVVRDDSRGGVYIEPKYNRSGEFLLVPERGDSQESN